MQLHYFVVVLAYVTASFIFEISTDELQKQLHLALTFEFSFFFLKRNLPAYCNLTCVSSIDATALFYVKLQLHFVKQCRPFLIK